MTVRLAICAAALPMMMGLSGCKKKVEDEKVRQPAVSGQFYPEKTVELEQKVDKMLEQAAEAPAAAGVPVQEQAASKPKPDLTCQQPVAEAPAIVRNAVLAGSWYDRDAGALGEQLDGWVEKAAGGNMAGYPMALIVPHAGYAYSGATAAAAYRQLQGRTYRRVFLIGPSHRARFSGVSLPEYTHYGTPLGKVPLAVPTMERLTTQPLFFHHETAHEKEHSLEIQLPFLQRVLGNFQLVPMLVSGLNDQQLRDVALALKSEIGPGDLLVASSDFTHYGARFGYYGPEASPFDTKDAPARPQALRENAWEAIAVGGSEGILSHKKETGDTICGILPIALLLEILPPDAAPSLLQADFSGRMTRDWENSVSYLAAGFGGLWPYNNVAGAEGLSKQEKKDLLTLARGTVDDWVRQGKKPHPEALDIEITHRLRAKSGAFVTLKKGEQLRGCIGTILPVKPLLDAVRDNAVNAAHRDRRFSKVTASELPDIDVEISVLTPPQSIASYEEIILGLHGVILSKNGRSAVFLPQVAPEQGWTVEQTLTRLSLKAGLGDGGWRSGAEFKVFEAIVFHEQ